MYSLLGFGNIKADIILIVILSVNLTAILLYNYRQKKLVEKAKDSGEPYKSAKAR